MPMLSKVSCCAAAAALLVLGASNSATADEFSRCSIAPFSAARDPEATYLLGTALPDTLLAGPGAVEPGTGPGHWGGGAPRRIYGQVIQLERFGGADSITVAQALGERDAAQVVIVPWDYDPSCRAAIWSRSAQWVRVGEAGMFTVRIRPKSQWVAGMPTFDAFMADLEPYPLGVFFQQGYRGTEALRTHPSLTAAEYYELYRALPDRTMIRQRPEAAAAAISHWEQTQPDLAVKYPATEVLRWARWSIERAQ
jgi:hypothetical protein